MILSLAREDGDPACGVSGGLERGFC
jgi:hypothetical protein